MKVYFEPYGIGRELEEVRVNSDRIKRNSRRAVQFLIPDEKR